MVAREWQFDGLVGPTHNYAGLAMGNLAAAKNAGAASNPRAAALQGLEKMQVVHNLGVRQAFLPPHYRPLIGELKRLGFSGDVGTILDNAFRIAPGLLAAVYSSSFMWAANAATVTPSADSYDKKLHLTPANLVSHFHRSIEAPFSHRILKNIFHNEQLFSIHNFLPSTDHFGDEGAANHMRVCPKHGNRGFNIFVYGKSQTTTLKVKQYQARQERLASEAIARLHGLAAKDTLFVQQSPMAIDQGVFHNDVIAMNTASLMIVHEESFIPEHRKTLVQYFAEQDNLQFHEVKSSELSVADAVSTYLFNSELLETGSREFTLIAPSECSNHAGVTRVVEQLIGEGALHAVHYLDVRESMRNGGGPACLRLRVVMTSEQEEAIHPGVVFTPNKHNQLKEWVSTHYRDRLVFDDLRDPELIRELDRAYSELESLIGMQGLYDGYRFDEQDR
jgi:succinylarginine dihydrolase